MAPAETGEAGWASTEATQSRRMDHESPALVGTSANMLWLTDIAARSRRLARAASQRM